MIDLPLLRSTLETGLAGLLGTYTINTDEGPQTTPAIAVDLGNGDYPPAGAEIQGLECVLIFRPDIPIKPLLGGWEETYSVVIFLKQWDEGRTTIAALDALLELLGQMPEFGLQAGSIRRTLPVEKLNNIETLQMTVFQTFLNQS